MFWHATLQHIHAYDRVCMYTCTLHYIALYTLHCVGRITCIHREKEKEDLWIVARKLAYWSMHGNQKLLDVLAAQFQLQRVQTCFKSHVALSLVFLYVTSYLFFDAKIKVIQSFWKVLSLEAGRPDLSQSGTQTQCI